MTKKKGYGNDSITALKGADRVRKNQVLFLVLTGWRVASMPYLRFCPMLLTRPVLATAALSPSPVIWMDPSRWTTRAAAAQ